MQFAWILNGQKANHFAGINIAHVGKKTYVLSIDSLSEEHAGNYTCIAENRAGSSSYSSNLIVKGIFHISNESMHLKLLHVYFL